VPTRSSLKVPDIVKDVEGKTEAIDYLSNRLPRPLDIGIAPQKPINLNPVGRPHKGAIRYPVIGSKKGIRPGLVNLDTFISSSGKQILEEQKKLDESYRLEQNRLQEEREAFNKMEEAAKKGVGSGMMIKKRVYKKKATKKKMAKKSCHVGCRKKCCKK
jgi:hypothetical protein